MGGPQVGPGCDRRHELHDSCVPGVFEESRIASAGLLLPLTLRISHLYIASRIDELLYHILSFSCHQIHEERSMPDQIHHESSILHQSFDTPNSSATNTHSATEVVCHTNAWCSSRRNLRSTRKMDAEGESCEGC